MRSPDGPNLVIRSHSPKRRFVIAGVILVIVALAMYIVYEYGRFNAGYDRLAAAQQRTELEVEIERLNRSNRELRTHLAELDTIRIGRAREQAEVTRTISDLQEQVAKQENHRRPVVRTVRPSAWSGKGGPIQPVNPLM